MAEQRCQRREILWCCRVADIEVIRLEGRPLSDRRDAAYNHEGDPTVRQPTEHRLDAH